MTRRRFYGEEFPADPSQGRKPEGTPEPPLRAWLTPKEHGLGEDWPPLTSGPGSWSMSLERPEYPLFDGDFEELVQQAVERGAVEFYVWSPTRQTFDQFTARTARPID